MDVLLIVFFLLFILALAFIGWALVGSRSRTAADCPPYPPPPDTPHTAANEDNEDPDHDRRMHDRVVL